MARDCGKETVTKCVEYFAVTVLLEFLGAGPAGPSVNRPDAGKRGRGRQLKIFRKIFVKELAISGRMVYDSLVAGKRVPAANQIGLVE